LLVTLIAVEACAPLVLERVTKDDAAVMHGPWTYALAVKDDCVSKRGTGEAKSAVCTVLSGARNPCAAIAPPGEPQ